MTSGKIASAKQLLGGGMPPREVAKNLGVSIPTLYRWVPASSREVEHATTRPAAVRSAVNSSVTYSANRDERLTRHGSTLPIAPLESPLAQEDAQEAG
jgi:hypothetical protein